MQVTKTRACRHRRICLSRSSINLVRSPHLLEHLAPPLRFSVVGTAYLDALSILEEKGTCSEFFGGSEGATLVLNELITKLQESPIKEKNVGIRMSGEVVTVTNMRLNLKYRMFEKAIVNTTGPFFRIGNGRERMGSFRSATREARALMLLHELAHLMTTPNGDWLIPEDGKGTPPALNLRNTETFEAACRTPRRPSAQTTPESTDKN